MNIESPRRSDAVTAITQSREARLSELTDAANRERITADALDALANLIEQSPAPVAHFGPIWEAVGKRIRQDAAQAWRRSRLAGDRVDDVQEAIDARARFIGSP